MKAGGEGAEAPTDRRGPRRGMERVRTSYGYNTYRGRSKLRTFLLILIVILLVVLALAVAAFFLLQKYIVYGDDGRAHLELPFFQASESQPSGMPPGEQDILVVTQQPSPEPAQEPALKAVWLLRTALSDGTAADQVQSAGGNAAVFNMKADDGTLGYVSSLPEARTWGTSAAAPGLNETIRELTDSELYTIARVSCFKDNKVPRMNNALAIRTNSGYNWRDPEGIRWMNVSSAEARSYVVGVCKELAELGFDEILLENACYPAEGDLSYIKKGDAYDPENLSGPVEQFYQEVADALEGTGVKLSLSTSKEVMDGAGNLSGQDPELLGRYAARIYVVPPEELGDYDEALSAAGMEASDLVYVIAGSTAGEDIVHFSSSLSGILISSE